MTKKKKNFPKILTNFIKIHKQKFFQMKYLYMTKKEKSFKNTHKFHKNSKTYLDVQNEFAPKLKLSWVVSDPTQTCPIVLKFF